MNFNQILEDWTKDPNILGIILEGSRGKGFENEYSDHDVLLIVSDENGKEYKTRYANKKFENVDLSVKTLLDFKSYATWGSNDEWDRYDHLHVKILKDDTKGVLAKISKEKGLIPSNKKDPYIRGQLDGYLNRFYRSVKAHRAGNALGSLLQAANSIQWLLNVVFALNDRHAPFLDYVQQELHIYPLKELPWDVEDFCQILKKITSEGDIKTQQALVVALEQWTRTKGHGDVFDGWDDKIEWAIHYRT